MGEAATCAGPSAIRKVEILGFQDGQGSASARGPAPVLEAAM